MRRKLFRSCLILLTLWLPLAACSSALEISSETRAHMIAVDQNGAALEVEVDGELLGDPDCPSHMQAIADHIRESGKKRVLLFIHGGLVPREDALAAVEDHIAEMKGEDFYPIFVNWETGIGRSYLDHLFFVRGGERATSLAILTSPLYFIADMGRALMRYPVTLSTQGRQAVKALVVPPAVTPPPEGWRDTAYLTDEDVSTSGGERVWNFTTGIVPGALRFVTTPILDGVGRSAFMNMQRRARVLFLLDEDHGAERRRVNGALSLLMDGLRKVRNETRTDDVIAIEHDIAKLKAELEVHRASHRRLHEDQPDAVCDCEERKAYLVAQIERRSEDLLATGVLRVTVVAHSMGTIVANQLIRRNPDFLYDDIVFMGAACTIQEFADTTLVYVKENPTTHFHNLCLHPIEEANDRYAAGMLPHGSLLDWIDNYITDRKSALDGTMGKWQNIMAVLPVVDYLRSDVRSRIFVKGFGRGEGEPRDHGDFNDVENRWWDPSFWRLPSEVDHQP